MSVVFQGGCSVRVDLCRPVDGLNQREAGLGWTCRGRPARVMAGFAGLVGLALWAAAALGVVMLALGIAWWILDRGWRLKP